MTKEEIIEPFLFKDIEGMPPMITEGRCLEAMDLYAQSLLSEKWISVDSGELPPYGMYIVAYFNPSDSSKKLYVVTLWRGRYGWCFDRNVEQEMAEDSTLKVTHWQPIPSPPTK